MVFLDRSFLICGGPVGNSSFNNGHGLTEVVALLFGALAERHRYCRLPVRTELDALNAVGD